MNINVGEKEVTKKNFHPHFHSLFNINTHIHLIYINIIIYTKYNIV